MTRPLLGTVLLLGGCQDAAMDPPDLGGPPPPDLSSPTAKCAAAKGLSGENLRCVDFKDVSKTSDLMGWTFGTIGGDCWEIAANKLQVKNFASYTGSCGFMMPALPPSDYQKYGSFTLSVVHSVDLNKLQLRQSALIYLGQDVDTQQLWLNTGTNPPQTTTIRLDKAALPNGGSGTYQPLFKLTSTLAGGFQGWQIESIAIQGNP